MSILYRAKAISAKDRADVTSDSDGAFSVALVSPTALGGTGSEGASPEQLFAAGYSACFLSTLRFVASEHRIPLDEQSSVTAAVGIGRRDDGEGFGLDVALTVSLPEVPANVAHGLIEQAHIVCPYSHLARNGLDVRVSLAA